MESHPSTAGVSKYMSSLEITPCMRHTYCMPFDFAEKVLYLNRIVTFFLFLCFSDLAWIWRIDSRTLDFQFEFSIIITRENLHKKWPSLGQRRPVEGTVLEMRHQVVEKIAAHLLRNKSGGILDT